ncbi:MAG: ribosome small subunit-dependent GTPase A [Clostridiaceae bacterium]|nr:ribosome small subunit-dependent GTPase A [Clostridiaceae bacterium]
MPRGIILKGIGSFYYVKIQETNTVIECRARGRFRKDSIIPMVGDHVEVKLSEHDALKGSIEAILPRVTCLVRPPVANVDQVVTVLSIRSPEPNLLLLDKIILAAEFEGLDVVVCFNKIDLDENRSYEKLSQIYLSAGYDVICASARNGEGIEQLRDSLKDKVTAFAGPSGVGKSSLLNAVDPRFSLKTGEISKKIERGKHTTRHVELLQLKEGGYVVDTPGFSSFELAAVPAKEMDRFFREFGEYIPLCRFRGCSHTSEPGCAVIDAVEQGKIFSSRYQSYLQFYSQRKNVKEWEK